MESKISVRIDAEIICICSGTRGATITLGTCSVFCLLYKQKMVMTRCCIVILH